MTRLPPFENNKLCQKLNIATPIIGGAMYPCSNPELVAAISEAGGIGVIQPMSLTYVYGYDFRAGIQYIRSLTDKPLGLNLILEQSSQKYLKRSYEWLEIALEEKIGFYVTALGKPNKVVEMVHQQGGVVFHDVTERKFAQKALEANVDGFICVNNRAGGHAGKLSPAQLFGDINFENKLMVSAGGISTNKGLQQMLDLGYDGAQIGTRFIASKESVADEKYKKAIIDAKEKDIVLTNKISGVSVSVIKTPELEKSGINANWLAAKLLKGKRTKHWMRLFYTLQSVWSLKKASTHKGYQSYYQAGKSVEGIDNELSVGEIFDKLTKSP